MVQPPRVPDLEAQRAALKKLDILVGKWFGEGPGGECMISSRVVKRFSDHFDCKSATDQVVMGCAVSCGAADHTSDTRVREPTEFFGERYTMSSSIEQLISALDCPKGENNRVHRERTGKSMPKADGMAGSIPFVANEFAAFQGN
jgi:hypothetical protein